MDATLVSSREEASCTGDLDGALRPRPPPDYDAREEEDIAVAAASAVAAAAASQPTDGP